MKLFLLVSLLGSALASPGYYSSYSTAYGPLARSALAYGSYSAETAYTAAGYGSGTVAGYAAAPVSGYAAVPVTSYAGAYAGAPLSGYAAAPVAGYAAAPVAGYAAAPVAGYAAAPVAGYAAPVAGYTTVSHAASVAAAPVTGYAAFSQAPVTAYATAPASAVVPVTRVSAQPAVVQNIVDVAQPKFATRRYQVRRPAIQKQFYDVEERVVVRPAGSAVVELETPVGANQQGPTKITPAAPPVALQSFGSSHLTGSYLHGVFSPAAVGVASYPHQQEIFQQTQEIQQQAENAQQEQQQQQEQSQQQEQDEQQESIEQAPQQPSFPAQEQDQSQQQFDDADSVSVENPEFVARSSRPSSQTPQNVPSTLFRSQLNEAPRGAAPVQQFSQFPQFDFNGLPSFSRSRISEFFQPEPLPQQQARSQPASFTSAQSAGSTFSASQQQQSFSLGRSQGPVSPQPEVSQRQSATSQPLVEADAESRFFNSEQVVSSRNLSPEQSQANQARLIELLTARGPVTELRSASEPIRGRVLSATPAPSSAEPADERVNTRRIVVNRPIQTVQEVDVVEPFTKLERVAVHQPALVKTAHVELAHVPAAVHTAVPAVHAVTVAPHYFKK